MAVVADGAPELAAARRFRVARATVHRWVGQRARTGSLAPRPIAGRPRKIAVGDEAALVAQVQRTPDATLAEHCAAWAAAQHRPVSVSTMHHALKRLAWRRKNSPSVRPSKTP